MAIKGRIDHTRIDKLLKRRGIVKSKKKPTKTKRTPSKTFTWEGRGPSSTPRKLDSKKRSGLRTTSLAKKHPKGSAQDKAAALRRKRRAKAKIAAAKAKASTQTKARAAKNKKRGLQPGSRSKARTRKKK